MDAILVQAVKSSMRKWHWVNDRDPGRTLCGKVRLELAVIGESSSLVELPPVEACLQCVRTLERAPQKRSPRIDESKIYSESRLGRLRTTGPLAHGARSRHGRRI
jgi:hypothetical protein